MNKVLDFIGTSIGGIITSGVLTGFITLWVNQSNKKSEARNKNIDDRIQAWQDLSSKCESKIVMLENKLSLYEKDSKILQKYILELQRVLIKIAPNAEIPQMPVLECL